MQAQLELDVRDAQELFQDLNLSSTIHHEVSDSSATVDTILQERLESANLRSSSSKAWEPIDEDKEIATLIAYFENLEPQQAADAGVSGHAQAAALPPPVRFNTSSRKAIAKPQACAHTS